ncbi:MAG: cytochrome c1, partial [Sphingomonadaceae bacterium]|nr:cytochrome c1 [Sphingomonadaceae bacterium]
MIRVIGFLVGLGFCGVLAFSPITGMVSYFSDPPVETVEHRFHEHAHAPQGGFSSDGPFGRFDRQQLQRGFQVYKEVCAACHSLRYVAFRNLTDLGFSEAEVDAIADQWQIPVPSVNEQTGEADTRSAVAADWFPLVFANDEAARAANNNAIPPDLSLMTKARHNGAAYVYSLLTGYQDPPADLPEDSRPGEGLHYNPYFANLNLAMAPPLSDGQVSYADGTEASVHQMSEDVAAFLIWTAEPTMETRKSTGWAVLI